MIHHDYPQGSESWLSVRRGVITGSRFKDARDRLKSGKPSQKAIEYAMDLARERAGGHPRPGSPAVQRVRRRVDRGAADTQRRADRAASRAASRAGAENTRLAAY